MNGEDTGRLNNVNASKKPSRQALIDAWHNFLNDKVSEREQNEELIYVIDDASLEALEGSEGYSEWRKVFLSVEKRNWSL